MSSSSRSIAAARARRAGEAAPPISGGRPGTSIGSHAAFVPQNQNNTSTSNVRLARGQQPSQPPQQQVTQNSNGLPFSKLSISDAIGLITLRLGRIEQFVIDFENGENNIESSSSNIPENSKLIDNSVLTSIVNRIISLEKNAPLSGNNQTVAFFTDEISKINTEIEKTNLLVSKQNDKIAVFENDLTETKELFKSFMLKFDSFIKDTNDKFTDYEYAIAELEKNTTIAVSENIVVPEKILHENESEIDNNTIISVDLKNIIKEEFANESI